MKSTLAILSVCLLLFRTGECTPTLTLPAGGDQTIHLAAGATTIATIAASGGTGTVTYTIVSQSTADTFTIVEASGVISLATGKSLSTTIPAHLLNVLATDTVTGSTPTTTTDDGKLYITVNAATPAFCLTGYCVAIPETLPINMIIGKFQATDADIGTTLTYALSATNTFFDLNTANGVVTAKIAILASHSATSTIIIQAKDDGATHTGSTTVTIMRGGPCPSASESGATVLSAAVMTTAGALAMLLFV